MHDVSQVSGVKRALAEAFAWCSREAVTNSATPIQTLFRSAILKPSIDIGEYVQEQLREQAVSGLIAQRSEFLRTHSALRDPSIDLQEEGKILVYWPSENVSDGASEALSKGFFDVNDAPPWDTWFYYKRKKLYSWVPGAFVPFAQKGIDENIVDCIQWAEWSELSKLENHEN
jgi:hypothetical protein